MAFRVPLQFSICINIFSNDHYRTMIIVECPPSKVSGSPFQFDYCIFLQATHAIYRNVIVRCNSMEPNNSLTNQSYSFWSTPLILSHLKNQFNLTIGSCHLIHKKKKKKSAERNQKKKEVKSQCLVVFVLHENAHKLCNINSPCTNCIFYSHIQFSVCLTCETVQSSVD